LYYFGGKQKNDLTVCAAASPTTFEISLKN
jgi:hypothetical protein